MKNTNNYPLIFLWTLACLFGAAWVTKLQLPTKKDYEQRYLTGYLDGVKNANKNKKFDNLTWKIDSVKNRIYVLDKFGK